MKVYLDLIFILNFIFDFLILFSTGIILRRQINIKKIILGSLIGSVSIIFLFLEINSLILFIYKFIISIIMCIITFRFRNLKYTIKNISYLYSISILLGGFTYFINIQFNYNNDDLIFYQESLNTNFILLLFLIPIVIYFYIKQIKELKNNYSNYYKIDIFLKDGNSKNLTAFLDTGNKLYDPYKHRPIILVDKKKIDINIKKYKIIYSSYKTIDSTGLLKCVFIDKINIIGVGIRKNVLIGLSNSINIDGVDCILHTEILEGK
ncbi:MAG: sigma-E processing peptidase SpoIIGA [Bacilli bacterium]